MLLGSRTSAEIGLSRFEVSNYGRYAIGEDTGSTDGNATAIGLTPEQMIRRGAREVLQNAIEVEVRELLAEYDNVRTPSGAAALVRNGYLQVRGILSAVGPVKVRVFELSADLAATVGGDTIPDDQQLPLDLALEGAKEFDELLGADGALRARSHSGRCNLGVPQKKHEIANLCLNTIGEVGEFACNRLKSMQRRPGLVAHFQASRTGVLM